MFGKEFSKLLGFFNKRELISSSSIIKDVPYYSQWESPSLVKKILEGELDAGMDPLWMKSGAISREEYNLWARNMCGMACLKMIIKHKFGSTIPTIQLGKSCEEYGGYIVKQKTIDGLFYLPFCKFIKNGFDLDGEVIRHMSIDRIVKEVSCGNYVIASVSHEIRNPNSRPFKKGGHLVLILGYDIDRGILFFHNPSGDRPESRKYVEIRFPDFVHLFANRGIVIKK